MLTMLEAFRLIVTQVLELARYREKRANERFDGLIRPMYEQIQKVHGDYVAMFSTALGEVRKDVPLAEILEALDSARLESGALRHEFFRVVHGVKRDNLLPTEVQSFVGAIGEYVEALEMYSTGTPATVVRTYLLLLVDQEADKDSSTRLAETQPKAEHILRRALAHLEERAKAISTLYAGLLAARYV